MIALPAVGTWPGEVVRAVLLALGFFLILVTAEWWRARFHPPVEWTRKSIHLASGISAALLPWVIRSHWTALALALTIGIALAWARRHGRLTSLFGVDRASFGELYFPLGIYLLFLVSAGQSVFYLISLVTLVICDALAAVLGAAYGRHQYQVTRDRRSLEGSAVFLATAFLGVHLPLLLLTDIGPGASVLVALQLALLVTSFEAIAPGGSDNLVLPLATYYLLVKLTPQPAASVALQLGAQLAILAAMLVLARTSGFLTFSGAIAAHLVLYAAYSLGGPAWIVAPGLALAALVVMDRFHGRMLAMPRGSYDVRVIYYVSVVATLWIFVNNSFATLIPRAGGLRAGHPFFALFVGALSAALAVIAYWTFESAPRLRRRPPSYRAVAAVFLAFGTVVPVGLWALRGEAPGIELATAGLVCVLGLGTFVILRRALRKPAGSVWDLRLLAAGTLVGSLAVMPLHLGWLRIAFWSR